MHAYFIGICICFSYVRRFPSNLMDSVTEGGSPLPIWRRPKAASIKFDGNVANVRKTYANTYQIFVHLDILWILWYFPYVVPGAIYLAESVAPSVEEFLEASNGEIGNPEKLKINGFQIDPGFWQNRKYVDLGWNNRSNSLSKMDNPLKKWASHFYYRFLIYFIEIDR